MLEAVNSLLSEVVAVKLEV